MIVLYLNLRGLGQSSKREVPKKVGDKTKTHGNSFSRNDALK